MVQAADDPDPRQSFVLQQQQLAALATIAGNDGPGGWQRRNPPLVLVRLAQGHECQ